MRETETETYRNSNRVSVWVRDKGRDRGIEEKEEMEREKR